MAWQNFSIWRGRLPHWRADGVTYYATFRHRRPLTEDECVVLLRALTKPHGRRWNILIVCVLPETTELVFTMSEGLNGEALELSDVLEKAKTQAGKEIMKRSGERFPPFYHESYDRIIRDDAEWLEHFEHLFNAPVKHELSESSDEYPGLWVSPVTASEA